MAFVQLPNPLEFRSDPVVAKVLSTLVTDRRYHVDASLLDELESYSAYGKQFENISGARYKTSEDLHGLACWYEQIQFYRCRVMRIKMGHVPIARSLRRMWSACSVALMRDERIGKLSPASYREQVIQCVLEPLKVKIDQTDNVIDASSDVDKLLSNTYYTIREIQSINMAFLDESRRERNQ